MTDLNTNAAEGAEQDLEAIHSHIAEFDCATNANHVLDELVKTADSLSSFPERGCQVIIHLISDGRRDMQSVLARRLLGA